MLTTILDFSILSRRRRCQNNNFHIVKLISGIIFLAWTENRYGPSKQWMLPSQPSNYILLKTKFGFIFYTYFCNSKKLLWLVQNFFSSKLNLKVLSVCKQVSCVTSCKAVPKLRQKFLRNIWLLERILINQG